MTRYYNPAVKQKIHAERILLMLPLNVVMTAHIKGKFDANKLRGAVDKLRMRHALLAVRVEIDGNDQAWYRTEGVPALRIREVNLESEEQWLRVAEEECRTPFLFEEEPLIRFALVSRENEAYLIICGHHAVCDGKSLTWLLRDILELIDKPDKEIEVLPVPPVVDETTVEKPVRPNFIAKSLIGLFNKIWAGKNRRFSQDDMVRLHKTYWDKNACLNSIAWKLDGVKLEALASRCKDEKVTINTLFWTAFLKSQYEIQGASPSYRHTCGMAVNTRDRLLVPVGESLGFYAASLTVKLKYNPYKNFWDMAREFHATITGEIENTDLFRMLIAEFIHPTLLDSIYFSKYDIAKSRLSEKLLKKLKYDRVSYGTVITNVGKVDIPMRYGSLNLDSVFGPFGYSDVDEKFIGIITVGNKLTTTMVCNQAIVSKDTIGLIQKSVNDSILSSIG